MSRPIKLEGRALALAEVLSAQWRDMHAQLEAIEREAMEKMTRLKTEGNAVIKAGTAELWKEIGIPEDQARKHYLDAKYIEFGDAYVCPFGGDAHENDVVQGPAPLSAEARKKLN